MVRKDGAEVRRQRMHEVATSVLKALQQENPLTLSKTLAALQYSTGLTREKLYEYLNVMQENGHFAIDVEKDQIAKVS
jgi:DNA-binding IclR family transcriptional regulator